MRVSTFLLFLVATAFLSVGAADAQTVLIDKTMGNGSFEIFGNNDLATLNPSESGLGGDNRFATRTATEPAVVDGWTAITPNNQFAGFDGNINNRPAFDDNGENDPIVVQPPYSSDPGMTANAQEYAFVNSGTTGVFTSSAVTHSSEVGDVIEITFYSTINDPGSDPGQLANADYEVAFLLGDPSSTDVNRVVVGSFTDARSDDPDNPATESIRDDFDTYIENTFLFAVTAAADSIAVEITLDNSNGGNDQPRFDAVSLIETTLTPGDVDGNGIVEVADALDMAPNMFATPPVNEIGDFIGFTREEGDLTGDGFVNHFDYLQWRDFFPGAFTGSLESLVASVPEPTSFVMLAAFATCGLVGRRR